MKNIFLVFSLLVSTVCFGQVDSKGVVGSWSYSDATSTKEDSTHSQIENFNLDISDDGNFKITTDSYSIIGTWQLKDSVLTLEGDRSDKSEHRIEDLVIQKLTESEISFSIKLGKQENVLMNLGRTN